MSDAAAKLMEAALSLPEDERRRLAEWLFDSLDQPPGLSECYSDYSAVIRQRVEEIKSGKVQGVPGDVLMARLRKKYSPASEEP